MLTGIVATPYCYNTLDDSLVGDEWGANIIEEWSFTINSFYFLAFESDNDGLYFFRYMFRRDRAGRIDKVYDPVLYQSITAPPDHHIEYEVRKNDCFWYNDFKGGKYDVVFRILPNDSNVNNPVRKTYYGYELEEQTDEE